MAREPIETIAAKCKLSPKAVRAYQQLFFGIADKLDARDFIHSMVIGTHQPWLPTDPGKVWRYFGFVGGPQLVDRIVDHFQRSGRPDYGHLLSRSPDTRERSLYDLKLESELRTRFCEFTPRQTVVLAGLAARHAMREPASPRQSPEIVRSEWLEQQLGEVFAAEAISGSAASRGRSVA